VTSFTASGADGHTVTSIVDGTDDTLTQRFDPFVGVECEARLAFYAFVFGHAAVAVPKPL
jgi:hypothetical protein